MKETMEKRGVVTEATPEASADLADAAEKAAAAFEPEDSVLEKSNSVGGAECKSEGGAPPHQ